MKYQISLVEVVEQPVAVAQARIPFAEIGLRLRPLFDRVYTEVQRGVIVPAGHNVVVYRDGDAAAWDVEAGVQIAAPCGDLGEVVCSRTPGGRVAATVHLGPYHGLGAAHDAVIAWCDAQGHRRAGVRWEVYGDWIEDEAKLRTDVFYLLDPR